MTDTVYSILLVEDEPAAARYIRSIIGMKCPGFSVTAEAENGREGLERVRELKPDLVITDVRMPVMDGIDFVTELKAVSPGLPAVIVSGYEEFEYARKALNTGVIDYLLKPVNPARLREVLEALVPVLAENRERELSVFLRALLAGGSPCRSPGLPPGSASGLKFRVAVRRRGGLPSRFLPETGRVDDGIPVQGIFTFQGRDSRETVHLAFPDSIPAGDFTRAVIGTDASGPWHTVVFAPHEVSAPALANEVRALCRSMDNALVPGETRVRTAPVEVPPFPDWDSVTAGRFECIAAQSRFDLLEAAVAELAASWEKEHRPLIAIESALRKLLHLVQKKSPLARDDSSVNIEYLLDAYLGEVGCFGDLPGAMTSLIRLTAGSGDEAGRHPHAPDFFESVLRYIRNNYALPLTLQAMCELFRISQTYMSKLFRKYGNCTFNEYLTRYRIEVGKRTILENPGMPLKEVAASVGYEDQFYFSRVFKSVTGIPPSGYQKSAHHP